MITIPTIPLKLIIIDISKDELSAIESRIIKNEIENSVVDFPVVRFMIAPKNELKQVKTIKQTNGKSSVIFRGTKR